MSHACEKCGRGVPPAEAAVSRRAIGAVRCWRCRREESERAWREVQPLAEVYPTRAYGLYRAAVKVGDRVIERTGLTASEASYRARLSARG